MRVFSVATDATVMSDGAYGHNPKRRMGVILLIAALFLSACEGRTRKVDASCASGSVCAGVLLEDETVFLYVRNNALRAVQLPKILGVNSTDAQFLVAAADSLDEARLTINAVHRIPADEESFVDLAPRGVAGVTVTKDEFKKLFLMSQGCHDVNVYFLAKVFSKKAGDVSSDQVRAQSTRICL